MKPYLLHNHRIPFFVFAATLLAGAALAGAAGPPDSLVQRLGVSRGICVVLGDPRCELALKLARETELLVYVPLSDSAEVESARRLVDAAGLYGTRIYVEKGAVTSLHLADNLADALVVAGGTAAISEAEALRVLRPHGKALLGKKEIIKPFPLGVDDWSHPYHGPDNNPVSRDQVARGPYLTQFLGEPRYAPLPQVAVASAGRVFKAFGHIAFKAREEPWLNTLAAFNGYNGTLLWRREIPPALMVHRNTLVATPSTLYFGDDRSCKVIDAATGELRDEIAPATETEGETFWKWMAVENGVLYALIGEQEERDPVIRAKLQNHGWPWNPLSPGYNKDEHTWGFGRTLLAIDPQTKKVLWRHRETNAIDSRALCLSNGRIFAFRFGDYLACIDARTGREIWRKTRSGGAALFYSMGEYSKRQDWRTNWRTTAYLKASARALYFAGPTVNKLVAVSADNGSLLWEHPYNNYQIVLREDGLWGVPGQVDKDPTRRFDPLTGTVLEEISIGRRACTRVTSSIDAIFCRANGGSTRLEPASGKPELVSPMRPNCHDGVTIANGLLYWWPSTCDCNLTLYGITCLGPAADFDFNQAAVQSNRLEVFAGDEAVAAFPEVAADWPRFRANSSATVTSAAGIPRKAQRAWEFSEQSPFTPTAPTTVGDLAFIGGSDGIVRALNAVSGKLAWKAFTGGAIRHPPTIAEGRAYVGSGDGYVYALEAKSGRALWRFRVAPMERRIPVYGELQSTWPAASGVLIDRGTAYVAAGIVNYDGTHVYALDAVTGRIKWQNNTSGHLDPEHRTGVSVQGHMMLADGKLYLAGGNAVSPAIYDTATGQCLNEVSATRTRVNNNIPGSFSPRGSELYRIGEKVLVAGKPFYADPKWPVYDGSVIYKTLLAQTEGRTVAWANNARLLCFDTTEPALTEKVARTWGRPAALEAKPAWERTCKESTAVAVARDAVVVASRSELLACDLASGAELWRQPLADSPVPWGLAIHRSGRLLVTLENGKVVCFSASQLASRQ